MTAPAIIGLGHLDFTVTDGDRAMRWWEQVMGFKLLAKWGEPGYRGWTMVHPSGLGVTAVTHDEGDAGAFAVYADVGINCIMPMFGLCRC